VRLGRATFRARPRRSFDLLGVDPGDDTIQLGVEYDRELLANIAERVAPAIGATPPFTPSA
jgi:hypothetical protein